MNNYMSHCSCVCKVGWGRVGWAPRSTPLFVAAHQASQIWKQFHAIQQSLITSPTEKGSDVFAVGARSSQQHTKCSLGRHSRKTSYELVSIKKNITAHTNHERLQCAASLGAQLQQHSKCSLGRSIYACSQHIKCQRFQNSSVLHNLSYRIMNFVINLYVCNYVCNYDNYNRHVRFCNSPNQRWALALQRHASHQAKKKCTAIPLTGKANKISNLYPLHPLSSPSLWIIHGYSRI